jgi:hypothetical protein
MYSVTPSGRKMPKRTDVLTERVRKLIESLRVQHGAPGRPMGQKTLARRSGQKYPRVHKFLSGQMPYPPMDFLDALLRSFGTTLGGVLTEESEPPKVLPIWRADVQQLAELLDDADAEVVEKTRGIAELFVTAGSAGPRPPLSGPGRTSATKGADGGIPRKRGTRRE